MFFHQDSKIEELVIHRVGNKARDEYFVLSDQSIKLDPDNDIVPLLMQYYFSPFQKSQEVYRFHHPSSRLDANQVYFLVNQLFENEFIDLIDASEGLLRYLYDTMNHPSIKGGEVSFVRLSGVQMEGEECEAIGIFMTESKESVLTIKPNSSGFDLNHIDQTVNINTLDKGVIIINDESEEGYKVLIAGATKIQDSIFWKDDFLSVFRRNDNYQQTTNLMHTFKNFVDDKLDENFELGRTDKADLLNKATKYMKEHDEFDQEEFAHDVIGSTEAISLFTDYKKQVEEEFDMPMPATFSINGAAVKKHISKFKSVIKLDNNFELNIKGKSDLIERGYDEEKGKSFYKIYFENEN